MDQSSVEEKAPTPGTPEYDAAMAEKADKNAAKAIEDSTGVAPVEAPEEADEGKVAEEEVKTPDDAAKEALADAGLDFEEFSSEFSSDGVLSEGSYEKLEKAGIPREYVDSYIEGQKALAAQRSYQGYEAAGGREQFAQMQEWAKTSMTKAEIELFNKSVEGTEEEMLQAIRGLKSRFETEYGRQPNLLGGRVASGTSGAYQSRAEMVSDMKDPRYTKDPAFRAKVEAKVANSTAF